MTDTRQSNIEESIATENERDELRDLLRRLRQWVATSQALAPQLGRSEDFNEGKALALAAVAGWLDEHVPTDEPRYATAEGYDDIDYGAEFPGRVRRSRLPDGATASGAQPFDPAKHSDKQGTAIGRG